MDISTFITAVLCLIDDRIPDLERLRARGSAPTLFDSEVITIELVGELLGLDEDTELFAYFRHHYAHHSSYRPAYLFVRAYRCLLFHEAGVGARAVVPVEPAGEEGPLAHRSLPTQPSDG